MSDDWKISIKQIDDIPSVKQQDARDAIDKREECNLYTIYVRGYVEAIQRFYYRSSCVRAEIHVGLVGDDLLYDCKYSADKVYPSLIAARNRFKHGDQIKVVKRRNTVYLLRKGTPLHPEKGVQTQKDISLDCQRRVREIAEQVVTDFVRSDFTDTTITSGELDATLLYPRHPYPFDRFVNALRYQRKNITNGSVRISQTDTTVTLTRTSPYLSLIYRRDK